MGYAEDVIARFHAAQPLRHLYESAWADCIALTLPGHEDFTPGGITQGANRLARGPMSDQRGRRLYDSVGCVAVDRLAAGMESLITPQSEKWHGLKVQDVFSTEQSDEETEYFDRYRDFLFAIRYQPQAGFVVAHQRALRQCISLGTGVVWLEEALGVNDMPTYRLPFRYRYLPITRVWLERNKYGITDCIYFLEPVTARVLIQRYGDRVSQKVKTDAADPKTMNNEYLVLVAVFPRSDRYGGAIGVRNSAFESCHIEYETKHPIRRSGFFEFPASIYHWSQTDGPYSESPVMFAMAELKTLQAAGKSQLRVAQNSAEPALAVAHDGVKVRLNQNPRAVNYGMVNPENGQLLVKPIITGELTQAFNEFLNGKREAVNDALYIRLFQVLVQNPQMTATEAMLRNNEKGELLGPAGGRIQEALSAMIERETAILGRKGVYAPGTPLTPPQSLSERDFGPMMTSPLDRLRRMPEALAMDQIAQTALGLAEFAPEVTREVDWSEYLRTKREILGAPAKILKRREEVEQERAAQAEQQAKMAKVTQAEQEGKAGKAMGEGMLAMAAAGQQVGPAMAAAGSQQAA